LSSDFLEKQVLVLSIAWLPIFVAKWLAKWWFPGEVDKITIANKERLRTKAQLSKNSGFKERHI